MLATTVGRCVVGRYFRGAASRGMMCLSLGVVCSSSLAAAESDAIADGLAPQAQPRPAAQPTAVQEAATESTAIGSTEVNGLRALLEFESVFLLGWVYYLTTADHPQYFDVDYRWDVFRRKISGQSFAFDTNHFGTNFIGHPLGGAGYYLSARSNGAGTLGSSAVAIAGSLIWEMFGEVREEVSMNDMIVTPMAGIAIGETTYQLARFFDRSEGSFMNRGLGLLLGPFTTINNELDRTAPHRVSSGYSPDGWHQVTTGVTLAPVYEHAAKRLFPEAEVHADVRVENFDVPKVPKALTSEAFDAGNVTQLRVEVAASSSGVSRVEVATHSVLAGLAYDAARRVDDSEFGYVGLGMGFRYTSRSYQRASEAPRNRVSSVQPFGLATGHHVRRGAFSLDSWLRVGPAFGGMDPLRLTLEQKQDPRLPPVAHLHGYYLGWGASSEAAIRLGVRDLSLGAAMAAESYRSSHAPGERAVTRMLDSYRQIQSYFGYHFPGTSSELRATWVWRDRSGTVERDHLRFNEHSLGLQLCALGN